MDDCSWGRPCINQHEMAEILGRGIPSSLIEDFDVVQTEPVDMTWEVDGMTLAMAIQADDRTTGFRILYRHLFGPDRNDHLEETLAFMKHHWPAWRETARIMGTI